MKRLLPILSVITWAIASHPRNPVDSGSKLSPCLRAPPPVHCIIHGEYDVKIDRGVPLFVVHILYADTYQATYLINAR
jgi:hypothetical protein